jgi:glycosyltransferase involved in cell wall biosynthesis
MMNGQNSGMKKLLLVGSNTIHTHRFIELIRDYFDDIILLTNSSPENYKGNFHVFNFSLRNPFTSRNTIRQIRKIARSYRPSLIHIHQANSAAWLALRATSALPVKKILTAWGSDILVSPAKGFLFKKMAEQILARSDYFTADATFLAERMIAISPKKINVAVINFGIEPICRDSKELQGALVQKENIVYSNRLHKKLYRIDDIIRAFSAFAEIRKSEKWKLVIAGIGEETHHLEKLAHSTNVVEAITFEGWVNEEENNRWYRKARIFVSYPESDATSSSLLEALSAGCIPLLSDIPANREWIVNGKNGILTSTLSPTDFENALRLWRHSSAEQNLEIILQKATRQISRKLFTDIYDHALSAS